MSDLPFTLATGLHERARPLAEGRAKPEGLALTTVMLKDNGGRHERFLQGEFDAAEFSFALYLRCMAQGAGFAAIPVFLNRQFRHGSIYVNSAAGINQPKDLEGRRVGIMSWFNSAALWARGLLQHEYGLDLTRVEWVSGSSADTDGFDPPPGIRISAAPRADLVRLLLDGDIAALVTPRTIVRQHRPKVARLFPDVEQVEAAYYRKTGIFPMSHALVVRTSLLDEHPWLAGSLGRACLTAKDMANEYADDPEHSTLAWFSPAMERETEVFGGDGWPYGIEPNRPTLEALVTYGYECGLLSNRPPVEDLFHPTARVPF